ncbi:MAG: MotA/TolQ/ExbB proton channel family protein [Planctomycetes bacterium]|nr:MotA/TolQ/ExbB proton channel family protein [Planctomycetota bacterium]
MPIACFAAAAVVPVPRPPADGLYGLFLECGVAGPVLLLLGVVAGWKAVVRWLALRPQVLAPDGLQRGLEQALRSGQIANATTLSTASGSALGRLVAAGLLLRAGGLDEMLANCERAAMQQAMLRQAGAASLARFGTVILLFAVFGTVTGVMSALTVLESMKEPTVQLTMTGIREALGCTAIGLALSTCCFLAWSLLASRAAAGLHRVREIAEELLAEAARPDRAG